MEILHKHHIVPTYKCIELGLTTSYKIDGKEFYFKENMVEVSRTQHANIHWGYKCNELKPLLEVCNPPQWVIDMIPLGDNRDSAAASIIALGEIEQIDISGENNSMWKGGIWVNDPVAYMKAYMKAYSQTPKHKAQQKAYQQTPEYKEYDKKRRQTPEYKAYKKTYDKAYRQTPEYKEYHKEYDKKRRQIPENKAKKKAYDKEYQQTPEYKEYQKAYQKAYYLRKKLEKQQGQGTLEQHIG